MLLTVLQHLVGVCSQCYC